MKKYNYTLEQALRYLKKYRSYVRPNPGFLMQLLEYEKYYIKLQFRMLFN